VCKRERKKIKNERERDGKKGREREKLVIFEAFFLKFH